MVSLLVTLDQQGHGGGQRGLRTSQDGSCARALGLGPSSSPRVLHLAAVACSNRSCVGRGGGDGSVRLAVAMPGGGELGRTGGGAAGRTSVGSGSTGMAVMEEKTQ